MSDDDRLVALEEQVALLMREREEAREQRAMTARNFIEKMEAYGLLLNNAD